MKLKNSEVCHSYRRIGHWLKDCDMKQRCPICHHGYVRWLRVEDPAKKSVGKMFFNCNAKGCNFYKWDLGTSSRRTNDEGCSSAMADDEGSSSTRTEYEGSSSARNHAGHDMGAEDESEDFSHMFKLFARLSDERNVKISFSVDFSKGKSV